MKIPTIAQAKRFIKEAETMNPGPWVAHSYAAAENAKCIAEKCSGIDAKAAYVMGLLHDIGRREGVTSVRHVVDGYTFLAGQGYEDAARICLTHSFPVADIHTIYGEFDCTPEQSDFLEKYIADITYDDYDRLIQLCDAVSLPQGAVVMEKRFVDGAMRYGLPDFTLRKWQAYYALKEYFDRKAGCNIYTVLPNIMENTIL